MELVLESNSPDETKRLASTLSPLLNVGDTLALLGDLGAGKTCFVQGLAQGLSVPAETRITSPTFTLINEYFGGRVPLIHVDLYRLEHENELPNLGLEERLDCGIGVVEWADKFKVLPSDHLKLAIEIVSEETRRFNFTSNGKHSQKILSMWKAQEK